MSQFTCFRGALIRHAKDDWRWSDGTPEPRVRDLSASNVFNFRIRSGNWVEVLLSQAHRERDVLGWVLAGIEAGDFAQADSGDHSGPVVVTDNGIERMRIEPGEDPLLGNEPILHKRAIPRVALVPIEQWDEWAAANPYGATWDQADQDDLLALADQHRPPGEGEVSQ